MLAGGLRAALALLEGISLLTGRLVSWLALGVVAVMMVIVVLRYGFDIGGIALQESALYLHAALFVLGAGYTLARDEHVRVDIFYQRLGPQGRARIDLLGSLLLLLPLAITLFVMSLDYVLLSWARGEGSQEAGGLPFLYLLKSLLLVLPTVLLIQAAAEMLRALLVLTGHPVPPRDGRPTTPQQPQQESEPWQ
ncbi:TRAP transporter small permease subunit [Alcanivorax sp. JB21]|uniref:TRAP transporter small permease subunit n=1 Tax=Alcanivorax limicola TaxID=2874102 RepID=UPI001CC121E3|nr:TRAP transporter small permease subunit [Alcanivorax limicola]MBZ2188795.1 TRAP transporter small permease subunit [Alcanivorax limicola]